MRKFITLILAVMMCALVSVTAFAEEIIVIADDGGQQTDASCTGWENLTYKGGLSAYNKAASGSVQVFGDFGEPVSGPIMICGYVVGTPYVPPATNTTPATTPDKQEEPITEDTPPADKPTTENANLSASEISTISTDVLSMLKFAVSTREDSKVAKYVLPAQEQSVSAYFANRNADILKLDDKSEVKTGIQAVKTMMPALIKADKAKVGNVSIVSEDEVALSITVPVFSTYKTLNEDMLKQIDKELDVSTLGSIGAILSDPLKSRSTVDATQYSSAMNFFTKFGSAMASNDLYTSNPDLFETGTMNITLRKVDGAWKVDAATVVINVKIDGADTQIRLIPV